MKKTISIMLTASMTAGLFTSLPAAQAAEAATTRVLQKELYRQSFNELSVSEDGIADGAGELRRLDSAVQVSAGAEGVQTVTVAADESAPEDKYLKFTEVAENGSNQYIGFDFPEAITNGGIYHLSYDIKWTQSGENGPFVRAKSYHYAPNGMDLWGPNLSLVGPYQEGSAQMYGTFGKFSDSDGYNHAWWAKRTGDELNNPMQNDVWHNVEMVFNANTKTIAYYYDGTLFGTDDTQGYEGLVFSGSTKRFQLHIQRGWQAWGSVLLDNISYTKEMPAAVWAEDMTLALSDNGMSLTATLDQKDQITSAKVVNAVTGENLAGRIETSQNKVYLHLTKALDASANYCIYLDGAKRHTAYIKQGAEEMEIKSFDFSQEDGITLSNSGTGAAKIENGILTLKGTASEDSAQAILSLENDAIPAGASYVISYRFKSACDKTIFNTSLANDKNDWYYANIATQWDNAFKYANYAQYNWWDMNGKLIEGIDPNVWYNITMRFDAATQKIDYYTDGVFKGSVSDANLLCTVDGYKPLGSDEYGGVTQLRFNGQWGSNSAGLNISIDDVTVKLVSSAEIHAIDWAENDLYFARTMDRPIERFEIFGAKTASLAKNGEPVTAEVFYDDTKDCCKLMPDGVLSDGNYTLTVDGVEHPFTVAAEIQEGYTVSSFKILDADGTPVRGIDDVQAGDTVYAQAAVQNGYVASKNVLLTLAAYQGDQLVGSAVKTVSITGGKAMTDSVGLKIDSVENLTLKAFLWDQDGFKPLCDAEVCNAPFEHDRLLINVSFDEGNSFDSVSEGGAIADGLFRYTKGKNVSAIKNFGKSVSDDVLHVGFEYKPTCYLNFFWIRILGTGVSDQLFADRGAFCYYPDSHKWDISDQRAGYEPNQWYHIDIYADFESNMLYYYKNGSLFGSTAFLGGDQAFDRIEFHSQNGDETYLDQLVIEQLAKRDERLPKEVRQKAAVSVGTDAIGRIFYDPENVPVTVTVKNKRNLPADCQLNYFVYEEDGTLAGSGEEELSLRAQEERNVLKTVRSGGYGYYTFKAQLNNSDGTLLAESIPYRFSVCRAPEEGVKNNTLGVQMTTSGGIDRDEFGLYKQLPMFGKLGFTSTRAISAGFGKWNAESHTLDFNEWDRKLYTAAKDSGMEIFHVMGGTNSAFQINGKTENPPRSTAAIKAFAEAAVAVCDKYKEIYGHSPKDFDVWNEYWMTGSHFNPDNATPAEYANMLITVYQSVKTAHPDTKIWGLSGVGMKTERFEQWDALAWTEEVLQNLQLYNELLGTDSMYMDGISMHPYTDWKNPEDGNAAGIIQAYRDLFAEYGFSDVPVTASEWGWASGGSDGDAWRLPDEEKQASYFVRANVKNQAEKLFDQIIWYGSSDVSNDDSNRQNNYGLIRGAFDVVGYEAKPQYLTAGAYMDLMTGAEYVDTVTISDQVKLYRFRPRDKKSNQDYLFVLWAKDRAQDLNIQFVTENQSGMTLIDSYGNESQISCDSDNVYALHIGIRPCYLRGTIQSFLVK